MNWDQRKMAALRRPFTIGMLYDAHKDELITGVTLWDTEHLHTSETSMNGSKSEVTVSDSIESKFKQLSVDTSLQASFLGGLVDIEGSAKFLNDQKEFKNQVRVTFKYNATTTFVQLSIDPLVPQFVPNPDILQSATHVITGIQYGANAFFVFDSEKLDASSVQDIQVSMQALITKIPSFDVNGSVDIHLTEEERSLTEKFSCKFIGDLLLPSNPSTFIEAVQAYVNLPQVLKENQDGGVPLTVWLTPLKTFVPIAAEIKCRISEAVVRKAVNALEDVGQAEMRCNDCLDDEVVENVPLIYGKLKLFKKYCEDYRSQLQQMMWQEFPLIRKGQEENASVEKALDKRQMSPFSSDNLSSWLDNREREINVIRSLVDMTAGTNVKMVADKSGLDREILAPGVKHALCFVFTSVEHDDPYLVQMSQYLDSHDTSSDENVHLSAQDPWYNSDDVYRKMKEKAAIFHDLANSFRNNSTRRFLVATVPNQKYTGATIYHYKDGVLVTDDFTLPSIPDVTAVTDRNDFIWYDCDLTMDPDTVNGWLTLSDGGKKATCGDWRYYPDCPERFDKRTQVLCTQALTGRHYWEVEWSEGYWNDVAVGVTYETIKRKGRGYGSGLGSNKVSWCIELYGNLRAWHNGKVWSGALPKSGCSKIGVYLDHQAGTLSFYDTSSNTLSHIYTFNTTFSDPVYPGFYIYYKTNYACLCAL